MCNSMSYEYVRVVGCVWCDTGERGGESARARESERARERALERREGPGATESGAMESERVSEKLY